MAILDTIIVTVNDHNRVTVLIIMLRLAAFNVGTLVDQLGIFFQTARPNMLRALSATSYIILVKYLLAYANATASSLQVRS